MMAGPYLPGFRCQNIKKRSNAQLICSAKHRVVIMAPSAIGTELLNGQGLGHEIEKIAPKVKRQIDIEGGTSNAKVDILLKTIPFSS